MSIRAYIVDWPVFVADWKARPKKASTLDFYVGDAEEPRPWLVQQLPLWTDSPITQMYASEVYEDLRLHMDKTVRRPFDKLFGVFFWWNEAGGRFTPTFHNDLGKGADPEQLAITMKPATVAKYLAMWDEDAFGTLRTPFKTEFPNGNDRIETFSVFTRYVKMWIGVLQKAARKERGLVVSVFGT